MYFWMSSKNYLHYLYSYHCSQVRCYDNILAVVSSGLPQVDIDLMNLQGILNGIHYLICPNDQHYVTKFMNGRFIRPAFCQVGQFTVVEPYTYRIRWIMMQLLHLLRLLLNFMVWLQLLPVIYWLLLLLLRTYCLSLLMVTILYLFIC